MRVSNMCLRASAMLCGSALIVSQVVQNLEHLGWTNALSGIGLAAVAVPVAMAVVVPVAQHSWTQGNVVSTLVAFVVLACGIGHTLVVALERGAHVRDQQTAAKSNFNFDLAKKAHDDAIARVRELEGLVIAEGKTGCRKACEAVKAALDDARTQAVQKQAALAKVGAPVDQHSMQKRYGYAAELVDTWHPLLLPLAMELGGWVLIGFAFHRGKVSLTSRPVPASVVQTKQDEAAEAIRKLRAEQGGKVGSVRLVSKRLGFSHGTTQRALKVAAS